MQLMFTIPTCSYETAKNGALILALPLNGQWCCYRFQHWNRTTQFISMFHSTLVSKVSIANPNSCKSAAMRRVRT